MTFDTLVVPVTLSESKQVFPVRLDTNEYEVDLGSAVQIVRADFYGGPYEVTPTNEEQILMTKEKTMSENVKINPIPSNYGLITWDGSTLTVS